MQTLGAWPISEYVGAQAKGTGWRPIVSSLTPYTSRYDGQLHPQEEDVSQSLRRKGYILDRAGAPHMFTPCYILFQTYRDFIAGLQNSGRTPLSKRQFGAAIRHIYGLTSYDKGKHYYERRRVHGYYGFTGPLSIRVEKHDQKNTE